MSSDVNERAREIGIRMALGADRRSLRGMSAAAAYLPARRATALKALDALR